MAVARYVAAFEQKNLEWIDIKDDEGITHRYSRVSVAPVESRVHVGCVGVGHPFSANLYCDRDGVPFLRQDGVGLPEKIVVESSLAGMAVAGSSGRHEYRRVVK